MMSLVKNTLSSDVETVKKTCSDIGPVPHLVSDYRMAAKKNVLQNASRSSQVVNKHRTTETYAQSL
jgi:hypothetical protein